MLSDFIARFHIQHDHEPTVISLGQVWIDVMMDVAEVPKPGEFIATTHVSRAVSGSYRILQAASRMGALTESAGIIGTGPCANMILEHLRRSKIVHTGPTNSHLDNGFRIVLNDGAKKTFVATYGAEAMGRPDTFAGVHPEEGDVVYISGNALMNETAISVNEFIRRPECAPERRNFRIVINPTNTLSLVSDQLLEHMVLAKPIWSLNRQEARTLSRRLGIEIDESRTMTVNGGFDESMRMLAEALADALRAPIVLRAGSRGAWVSRDGRRLVHIEGFETKATHTRSAGPVHTGALCALLAEGWDLEDAVQIANAAASIAIVRNKHGVPLCPTFEEATALAATAIEREDDSSTTFEKLKAALKDTDAELDEPPVGGHARPSAPDDGPVDTTFVDLAGDDAE
ncbi:sugar kinase [Bifidobacterium sp. BRDM6]|uniref:Sugar kinase n=1 Tax=Bifidobacterium choloepi TaxID=2614131 RepID=A0A6I5NHK0_9BIFI|nr:PfkB family carbohydrate kinase [Bifidobacterium choloepi]NEG69793.1 sugar kinase [Bifidobacterium choloepi]